ncbi:hypothetical protein TRAPUB_8452 [Trametes pubescens]|uniref:F-box domain-containing protein n=1 Tax=Trametes pubescens TaxID=154538 RepID=A0A1M2W569_TRAPU|nr:hypothetical protein TRAPUB_8452 [Trametes pubescens]
MQRDDLENIFLPQMYEEPEEQLIRGTLFSDISNIVLRDEEEEETIQGEEGESQSGYLDPAWKLRIDTTPRVVTSSNTLPPELLALIFWSTGTVGADPALNSRLIRLTHVCQYWRDVALQTPALWAYIALKHPSAVNAFLERSQALPLRIHLNMSPRPNMASDLEGTHTDALLAGFRRTHTLKISHLSSEGYDLVMRSIASGAPQLEVLSIAKRTIGIGNKLDHDPADVDGLPRLRSLKLHGEPLP